MKDFPEGNAIVYCEGAFNTTNGKTAHGLVRFTERYRILSVVDSRYAGNDAGVVLDGKKKDIPILSSIEKAIRSEQHRINPATHLVIGLAPDGGRLTNETRNSIKYAIRSGLHIDCGLHDFLSEDPEIHALATTKNINIRDIRKPPPLNELHFFSSKIHEVTSLKVAVLGTDSAIGKRTTAQILVASLRDAGYTAELIGTGQTAWMQGAPYSIILDSLINDFVSGEIEHVIWKAWKEQNPDVIVIEGQGSLLNPAYPGGFEILAAGRPDIIVLQHAPARRDYDGFPGYSIHPLDRQINALEIVSEKRVVAITINHEGIPGGEIVEICRRMEEEFNLPVYDVLLKGGSDLANTIISYMNGV